jgi:hypothetical protein
MSETIPVYDDSAMLRSRIAMFLRAGAGDPSIRRLLEDTQDALRCHDERVVRMAATWKRLETVLPALERVVKAWPMLEGMISDGK